MSADKAGRAVTPPCRTCRLWRWGLALSALVLLVAWLVQTQMQ